MATQDGNCDEKLGKGWKRKKGFRQWGGHGDTGWCGPSTRGGGRAVIPIKLWLVSRPASCTHPRSSLFFPKKIIGVCLFGWHACHYHCQVLKSTQVRILESAEDDSNSLKEFWIWTLRTLCYSTQFESAKSFQFKGFSLKISCSVVWGKAERDGFWGEGEVHQGETIKRVPRM